MNNNITTWYSSTVIAATTTITVGIGRPSSTSNIVARCPQLPFLRFSLLTDTSCILTVQGSINNGTWIALATITAAANVLATAYDLPTPQGDDGFLVIQMPLMRITLENPTVAAQTAMTFYAVLSNQR